MKQFNDYNETKAITERPKIPAGGYIATIKQAEVKEYSGQNGNYERLEISFDIAEGEYKEFYANDYRAQSDENKRWKGVLRLAVPSDDGTDYDAFAKRKFKTNILAVEDSNSGYHWDWDERKLKGKTVGILLQNREWNFNGMTGWTAQPYGFTSVESIKEGKFKVPKDKPLKNDGSTNPSASPRQADFEKIGDDDLPF